MNAFEFTVPAFQSNFLKLISDSFHKILIHVYYSAHFQCLQQKLSNGFFFIGKVISLISVNLTVFTINNEQSCKKNTNNLLSE